MSFFYIKRNEPKKDGWIVIMVSIKINGVCSQFSIKLLVNPDQVIVKKNRSKGNWLNPETETCYWRISGQH